MQENFCYIFGASECDKALKFVPGPGDFVIAADAGYLHLQERGIRPDLLIGDFDSLKHVPPEEVERVTFPSVKDDTDLMLAVQYAFDRGWRRFLLYGCMGGRLEFTLANFQILSNIVKRGATVYAVGCGALVTAVRNGALLFDEHFTGRISVFCSGGEATGVTLRGLAYPLDRAVLTYDNPLGVSNEFIGQRGSVAVENGTLIVIYDDVNNMMETVNTVTIRR